MLMRTRTHHGIGKCIAGRCDWAILKQGSSGDLDKQPRTIFFKAEPCFIKKFYNRFLPKIKNETRFILISGDADKTIPNQTDKRWGGYKNSPIEEIINKILDDPRLIHWYAENCDDPSHPKLSCLAVGLGKDQHEETLLKYSREKVDFSTRPLRAACRHRHRPGPQFETRREVSNLCETHWSTVVDATIEGLPWGKFLRRMRQFSFGICVTGGGIELAPKSWDLMLIGVIPIIKTSSLDEIYKELPVVIVDDWLPDTITPEKLKAWMAEFRPFYEDPLLREEVLYKLSMDYWWNKIINSEVK